MPPSLPSPLKCRTCREKEVVPTLLDYETEVEHDGRPYQIRVPQLAVLRCRKCHAIVLDDAANARISQALRAAAGLLTPEEIRKNRKRLALTQKELAHFLKVAESTVSRWESGGQIQQRAMDLLLRGFFEVPSFREWLGYAEPSTAGSSSGSSPVPLPESV